MGLKFRYFALIWNVADPTGQEEATRLSLRLPQVLANWTVTLDVPGLMVLSTVHAQGSSKAYPLARRSGVVLGTLFPTENGSTASDRSQDSFFSGEETDKILATRGRWLIDAYWGRYVAFVRASEAGTIWILKDPTGRLPCFVVTHQGLTLVFSYMPDVVAFGAFPLTINWGYVEARVAVGTARPDDTGIEAVSEVCGGECLEFRNGQLSRHLYWDPATRARDAIEDPILAARLIGERTKSCVHAWASKHDTWLHRLSGGLDSSVVLACLAGAPSRPRVACLTYCWADSTSSERPWARLAAEDSHAEHVEHDRTARMNFAALATMNLFASPPATSSFLETDRVECELTARYGATAISTGDGGDSLFGASAAHFSVSDYWKRRGPRPALLWLASDVALLRNQTVWGVLARTLRQDILRRRDRQVLAQWREARQLVRREIREQLLASRSALDHPWFRSGRTPLGVREILSFLTTPDLFYNPISSPNEATAESVFPLLSQPLVELCMSIPSYVHFDQGRDRGLARRAFANDVPAALLNRTWKDRVQGSMLMDGILVKERYLDRQAIERTLCGNVLKDTASVGEIVDHVLVEAWLRSWSGRCGGLA